MAALGGQTPVGVLLVLVGGEAWVPVEGTVGGVCRIGCTGVGARGQVGQAQADEGTDENSLLLVLQEVGEHAPRLGVGEGEGRREVVDDGPTNAFGLKAREEERHSWNVVVIGGRVDGGEWCSGVVSAGAHYPVRIVVVPGVIPQVRGYRSERRGEVAARVASW